MAALTDLLRLGGEGAGESAFGDALPEQLIEEVLETCERSKNRAGAKLPHWLVLRLTVYLAMFRDLNIPGVLGQVASQFGAPASWRGRTPHATSIAQARDRLGFEVVRELFRRFATQLSEQFLGRDRWQGLVVMALDGCMLDTPDSSSNVAAFQRPGGRNGSGGFPKLRFVALVTAASHFVLRCVVGPCKGAGSGETSLAEQLIEGLKPDWLVLMDKGFCAFPLLKQLGTQPFFVRKPTGSTSATPVRVGRYLRNRRDCWCDYRPNSRRGEAPLRLRWVRFKLPKKGSRTRWVEFLTNLDPERFPYDLLRDLYLQRWEVEFTFREIKTDLLRKRFFRSREPRRVLQELYGLLVAYNAARKRIAQAARRINVEPRAISFCQALVVLRLAELGQTPATVALRAIAQHRITKRRARSYPRAVKKPASKFAANQRRAVAA